MMDILFNKNKVREEVINYLAKNNIGTRIFYPPIHSLTPYRSNNKNL